MSVVGSGVVNRVRITADGQPHTVSRDGCTGTETARWSATGTRLYTTEMVTCGGGMTRTGSGVMAFTQTYEWLDVRGMSAGDARGVAVARYQALLDTAGLPAEVLSAFALRGPAANNAILTASAPLTISDIADVAMTVDSGVAAAWIVERTRNVKVSIDGKQLTRLADYGVPASVIDVLVAVSHPAVFALEGNSIDASFRERPASGDGSARTLSSLYGRSIYGGSYYGSYYGNSLYNGCYPSAFLFDPWFSSGCYSPYYGSQYSAYGSRYNSPYYSPYYGFYPGAQPIVIVNRPTNNGGGFSGDSHGRVVKGKGYTSGSSSGSSGRPSTGSSSGESSSAGASSGSSGSSAGSSAGSSSGSSGSARTAVPKPPGQ